MDSTMELGVICLPNGELFDLYRPDPKKIRIEDVASTLSKICRFGGRIDKFYSVAEHCCLCESLAEYDYASPKERLAVLLHDATEYLVGDVVTPLKCVMPDYKVIEGWQEDVIGKAFGVDFKAVEFEVKHYDKLALAIEKKAFYPDSPWDCVEIPKQFESVVPACSNPKVAGARFLARYIALSAVIEAGL